MKQRLTEAESRAVWCAAELYPLLFEVVVEPRPPNAGKSRDEDFACPDPC